LYVAINNSSISEGEIIIYTSPLSSTPPAAPQITWVGGGGTTFGPLSTLTLSPNGQNILAGVTYYGGPGPGFGPEIASFPIGTPSTVGLLGMPTSPYGAPNANLALGPIIDLPWLPTGIAVDPVSGYIFASPPGGYPQINEYDSSGNIITTQVLSYSSGPISGLASSAGIAVADDPNYCAAPCSAPTSNIYLFIADSVNNAVYAYEAENVPTTGDVYATVQYSYQLSPTVTLTATDETNPGGFYGGDYVQFSWSTTGVAADASCTIYDSNDNSYTPAAPNLSNTGTSPQWTITYQNPYTVTVQCTGAGVTVSSYVQYYTGE
jgi:hypothetical protein